MQYQQERFRQSYQQESEALRNFQLPAWEEFPDIELYMDQLIVVLNRYLSLHETGEVKTITASMINNYVKMKIMPPPAKKKYGRPHLAYLVVICLLKDALGTAAIQKLFPPDIGEEELQMRYNAFVRNQRKAYDFVAENIDRVAIPLLQETEHQSDRIYDLVTQICVSASITKLLSERFLSQQIENE